jgi:hypothetical protein
LKVRLKHQISGRRNGQEWPAPGEVVDLPEEEAQQLLDQHMAEVHAAIETPVETATVKRRPGRPPAKG